MYYVYKHYTSIYIYISPMNIITRASHNTYKRLLEVNSYPAIASGTMDHVDPAVFGGNQIMINDLRYIMFLINQKDIKNKRTT